MSNIFCKHVWRKTRSAPANDYPIFMSCRKCTKCARENDQGDRAPNAVLYPHAIGLFLWLSFLTNLLLLTILLENAHD